MKAGRDDTKLRKDDKTELVVMASETRQSGGPRQVRQRGDEATPGAIATIAANKVTRFTARRLLALNAGAI